MRRELKALPAFAALLCVNWVAKHIPMRRELKDYNINYHLVWIPKVAKHIPMRRELKDFRGANLKNANLRRKAHPDEKGTER